MFSSAKGTACDMDAISPMRRRHCRHVTLAPSLNCERQLSKDISLALTTKGDTEVGGFRKNWIRYPCVMVDTTHGDAPMAIQAVRRVSMSGKHAGSILASGLRRRLGSALSLKPRT
uniref:Uncharacterized protein n=1 Tax=Knipowitschia caucasica TaxID=637954 RepID=A0AAV2LY17_KNICA